MYVQKSYYLEYAITVYFCKISPFISFPLVLTWGLLGRDELFVISKVHKIITSELRSVGKLVYSTITYIDGLEAGQKIQLFRVINLCRTGMAVYYIGNRDRYGVLWPATTIARLCPCPDTPIFASGYPEKIITAIHLLHATTYKSINDNPGFAIYPNHTPLHENLLPSCERYTPLKGVSFGLSLNSTWMKMVSNPPRNIASTFGALLVNNMSVTICTGFNTFTKLF